MRVLKSCIKFQCRVLKLRRAIRCANKNLTLFQSRLKLFLIYLVMTRQVHHPIMIIYRIWMITIKMRERRRIVIRRRKRRRKIRLTKKSFFRLLRNKLIEESPLFLNNYIKTRRKSEKAYRLMIAQSLFTRESIAMDAELIPSQEFVISL